MTKPNTLSRDSGWVARMARGVRYVVTGAAPAEWFGPAAAAPAAAPAEVAGRALDYPVAYNLAQRPRAYEAVSFAELRGLADAYDLLRLVIETRKDQIEKFDWNIVARRRPGVEAPAAGDDPRLAALEGFFRRPDREHGWGTWLRMLLEDLLVIDAPTLYKRRDRAGRLHALEVIDGATIKRVIDGHGRTPAAPQPAYQQVLKGLPAVSYGADELIYLPRNKRPGRIYGCSPVEQTMMTVNIALRRQLAQLHYYTEGNVPEALIGVPEGWSPEQIRQFQAYWDALLEGNSGARRHAKFVPGAIAKGYVSTREPMLKDEYDEWLARVVCFAFSIAPAALTRQMNRATAATVQEAALAEGLAPLLRWVKQLIDRVIAEEFGWLDLEFAWRDAPALAPLEQARVHDIQLRAGIKTVDEVRAELGLDPLGARAAARLDDEAADRDARETDHARETDAAAAGADGTAKRALAPAAWSKYRPDQLRHPAGIPEGGQFAPADGVRQDRVPPERHHHPTATRSKRCDSMPKFAKSTGRNGWSTAMPRAKPSTATASA